jgi:translation initiation factor IF-2
LGKIKVEELASRMQVNVDVMIKKLQGMGQSISKGSDLVDEYIFKNARPENKTSPHIIRRKVKVVTTDDKGNEVERITTNAGGTIQKISVVHEHKKEEKNYSKEDLGVVRSKHSRNVMQNIVVTQNGKKFDAPKQEEIPNEEIEEVKQVQREETVAYDKIEDTERPRKNNYQNRPNNNYQNRSNNYDNNRGDFRDRPNYQNNRNDGTYQNRPYNPERRPYQGNNNNQGFSPRPNFNQNRPSNFDNNRRGFRDRPNFQNRNTTGYKVNQFIKETQVTDTIQKETRDYASTLKDKKKYNSEKEKSAADNKTQKKNVNEIREQNTRIDFNKFRGMQVSEEGLIDLYDRGESRKFGARRKKIRQEFETTKIIPLTEVSLPDTMTVKYFAESIKKQASEIIKKLFSLGIMSTVNQEIDFDTAFLIAGDFGITAQREVIVTEEDVLFDDTDDEQENMIVRPPVVTIMGHVDHGKTSLLDKIRSAHVVSGESGGITQHIGAYKVKINNREITFLDTPGHEAFTEMRARGASITDIVVIVVAADDSIKPQTIEAIQHAKVAGVPIIVAINKIDTEGANVEKVKQDLLEHELVPEEWGGDTICVPISAKTGEGIDNLLEMILLVADVKELKANPNKQAKGTVIEAKLDKTRGAVATVLVQRGTLNVGDTVVLGDIVGRIRSRKND